MEKIDPSAGSRLHAALARDIKQKLIELGPTYIKFGQMISTRPDIVRSEYVTAFRELQDRVPAFSSEKAIGIIESELGDNIDNLFDSFNRTPIAAASIGQVHIAEKNGIKFAVKIQRPGIKRLFDIDLGIMRILVSILDGLYYNVDGVRCNWKALFEEYTTIMYQELDYRREGLQGIRFGNNFKSTPWISVPHVSVFVRAT